jgi:hypothetical protein
MIELTDLFLYSYGGSLVSLYGIFSVLKIKEWLYDSTNSI